MALTDAPSPNGTDHPSATDILSDQVEGLQLENGSAVSGRTVQDVLSGSRILITGAAGFVGAALCHRLLSDPSFNVKQVVAIVRGATELDALKRLPKSIHHLVKPQEGQEIPQLVVVNGDCTRPNFGLNDEDFEKVRKTEIVIHCAGDTRFTLPVAQAFQSIVDLSYFSARFSLLNWYVKTHIHISTTFVGWYLRDGSLVSESLTPEGCESGDEKQGEHVNTYFHAKTYAEACVNSLFTSQVGRKLHGKTCRIVRLATLGPALEFPRPGWGSGHPSSPVCAALAAQVADRDLVAPGAGLDVIPVDLAVNQILSIAASAHALQSLPDTHVLHPKNPLNPTNQHLAEVPCYHVACGRGDESRIPMDLLNEPNVKIAEPYIPPKNLLKVYEPFICKVVEFDVLKTRTVLGIPRLQPDVKRSLKKPVLPDLPLKPGSLELDIVAAVQKRWGQKPLEGWTGYLKLCRDEMEALGPRSDWETYVD